MSSWRRRAPVVVLALGLVTVAAGLGHALVSGPSLPHIGTVPPAHAGLSPAPAQQALEPVSLSEVPQRMRLSAMGVDAPVQPVLPGPDRQLSVPESPDVVGWWSAAPRRVLGPARSCWLGTSTPAAPVRVRCSGWLNSSRAILSRSPPRTARPGTGSRQCAVTPRHPCLADLFDRTGNPRLALITCGGPFDDSTRQYEDNIVAYAVPA
ncbi:class F sortase [Saccharopolyspora spinosa]|uniref:class F sortase n=1 Tax=Saccharopolyspora spinosa TaxID=60894 RepID=UPI00376F2B54